MNHIILIEKEGIIEPYTTLTEACELHKEFSYGYIKSFKFPFKYKGWSFTKFEYSSVCGLCNLLIEYLQKSIKSS